MTWTILVCGDRHRSDDGAALVAAERLGDLPAQVGIRVVGQLEPDDLVAATATGSCLVLDAVRGVAPGGVLALPLADMVAGGPPAASSHALPLPTVVALAEALGAHLDRATFVGIGGEQFGLGEGLSPAVAGGLEAYLATITRTVATGTI